MKTVTIKSIKTNVHSETKFLFWYVFGASRGGSNRIKIISFLKDNPTNTNKLATNLQLEYKVIKHHLKMLQKNSLVTKMGERYGMTYFLSSLTEENMGLFEEIAEKANRYS